MLVEECCNAPDPMRQVSASYSLPLPCHLLACCILPCHHLHFISCHHVHCICIRVRLLHPSFFPVVRFAIQRSHLLRCTPFVSFRERVSNILGMDRGLSSGLIIPPGDHRSSFVPFGDRLVLHRLTGHPQSPFVCCSKTPSKPAQNPPNSLPCGRSFDHVRVGENRTSFGLS